MNGGTLAVFEEGEKGGTAILASATGGTLELHDTGYAELWLGDLDTAIDTSFTVTNGSAAGDTVRLGLVGTDGEGMITSHSEPGKVLSIGTMDGYASFVVNTDLAEGVSDKIEIGTATNVAQPNTVRIAYDPTLADGNDVTGANVTVATVGNGTEKAANGEPAFKGVTSTINLVDYLPEIATDDNGRTWTIRSVKKSANTATHSAVMGMEAGMAALAAGNAFIGAATDGLGLAANTGKDGVSAFAGFGGGSLRQDTGSHVNVNTWNAILALGHANKKERGTMEYGAFFEYGVGNYTTHDDDRRGDGSMRYTGGGLLAKWTANHGFYVEGSLRAGTVHDDARNVLHDDFNSYSYETDAGYFGAHLGVGKEFKAANNDTVDVYAKYFFNRRNGVSFTVENQQFDLDAVRSQILRVGARYTMKREKWNFYGGIAYEHELDGQSTGKVDGFAIRSADVKGGSFRAELGATLTPDKNSPWSLNLNVAGYAGKKQGFSGGVSVSFTF